MLQSAVFDSAVKKFRFRHGTPHSGFAPTARSEAANLKNAAMNRLRHALYAFRRALAA